MPRPKPTARLKGYRGPYARYMLEEARDVLIKTIHKQDTILWKRIRQKVGILENGERDDMFFGWGESSTIFSHADFHNKQHQPGIASVTEGAGPSGQLNQTYNPSDREPFPGTSSEQYLRSHLSIPPLLKENRQGADSSYPASGPKVGKPETLTSPDDVSDADFPLSSSIELPQLNTSSPCIQPIKQTCSVPSTHVDKRIVSEHREANAENRYHDTIKITIDLSNEDSNNSGKEVPVIVVGDETDDLSLSRDGLEVLADSKDGEIMSEDDSYVQIIASPSCQDDNVIDVDKTADEVIIIEPYNETSVDGLTAVSEVRKENSKFICDFCPFITSSKKSISKHLKKEVHFSASEHLVEPKSSVKYLKEKMVVTNNEALYKKIVAVCPSCTLVFSSTYECSYHYQQTHHHFAKPMYAVAKVMETENIEVPCKPISCDHCEFKSRKRNLHKHFVAENHFPFKTLDNCTHTFLCTICYDMFYTYELMCKHQELEHKAAHKDGMFMLSVLHLGQKICRRLPQMKNAEKTSQKRELEIIVDKVDGVNKKRKKKDKEEDSMNGNGEPSKKAVVIDDLFFIDRLPNERADLDQDKNETNINQDPATSKENEEDESNDTHTRQDLQNMFKCDYCDTLLKSKQCMFEHLVALSHHTASTVKVDAGGRPQFIGKKMTVKFHNGAMSSMVAVCPVDACPAVFENIYASVEHYLTVHEPNGERYYGLAKVAQTLTLDCLQQLQDLQCTVCKNVFDRLKYLQGHLMKFPSHLPYGQIPGTITRLLCQYCNKMFDTILATTHMEQMHKQIDGKLLIKVGYIESEKTRMKLLPFTPDIEGQISAFNSRIEYLKEMMKKGNVGKVGKKKIKNDIRNLRKCIDKIV